MTVYGTPLCKDCLAMKIIFEQRSAPYEFINITENTANLRTFLQLRDTQPQYVAVRESCGIGVPYFMQDERGTFDINEALAWLKLPPVAEEELLRITEECALLCK